jgi:hypothetical protein
LRASTGSGASREATISFIRRSIGPSAALLGCLLAALAGCGGGDGSDEADTPPPPPQTETQPDPGRPLEAGWYEDPDGDFRPSAIEEIQGTDPEANECLKGLDCPLISPETGLPREPPQSNTLLMLDSSGSMAGPAGGGKSKIAAARDSLAGFVDGAPGSLRAGFSVFGHKGSNQASGKRESCAGAEVVKPVGQVEPRRFPATLARFRPTGYTPIARALSTAPRAFAGVEEGARNRIILVTDGIETCGGDPVAEARDLKRAGIAVTVDVVGFDIGKAADRERLRKIAEASGGTYTDAQTGSALEDYFDAQRAREAQLLKAVNCVTLAGTKTANCSSELVTEASLAIGDLQSEAFNADDQERADALQEVGTEMSDSEEAWRKRYQERIDRVAERLDREREESTDRLQGDASSPTRRFAVARPLCTASPFVRTRMLLPREALLLAQRS